MSDTPIDTFIDQKKDNLGADIADTAGEDIKQVVDEKTNLGTPAEALEAIKESEIEYSLSDTWYVVESTGAYRHKYGGQHEPFLS